jgi:hypothetical protein
MELNHTTSSLNDAYGINQHDLDTAAAAVIHNAKLYNKPSMLYDVMSRLEDPAFPETQRRALYCFLTRALIAFLAINDVTEVINPDEFDLSDYNVVSGKVGFAPGRTAHVTV